MSEAHLPSAAHAAFWSFDEPTLLSRLGATSDGLTGAEAARRRRVDGPNRIAAHAGASVRSLARRQVSDPIVLLLIVAAVLALILGDRVDASIVLLIVVTSAVLGFSQEYGAIRAVHALAAATRVHAEVLRDGVQTTVPLDDIVVGDVVVLRAGDLIPADCRIIDANGLLVDQSALTGESYPVRKRPVSSEQHTLLPERQGAAFMGCHVVSGTGRAVVAAVGDATELGSLGAHLAAAEPPTSFELGVRRFGLLLVRVGLLIVAGVLAVNIVAGRELLDSVMFSLALAVGITPQLLPAIVTVTLAGGARQLARRHVLVKRLSSIEDIGSMDTLCVDKTGTLTSGSVRLRTAADIAGHDSPRTGTLARMNAHHQTGYANPIDDALLAALPEPSSVGIRLDEVPYDFTRKRLSVCVEVDGDTLLITKGALDAVLEMCTTARRSDGTTTAITDVVDEVQDTARRWSDEGARVLAVAVRRLPRPVAPLDSTVERDAELIGLLAFGDELKPAIRATVENIRRAGISVRLVTGDNRWAAAHVADAVGLDTDRLMTGRDLAAIDDARLRAVVDSVEVFAEVEPIHKARIVRALHDRGSTVGFLGDGINDAVALRAADVGISVDTAVDVAKESAAMVVLDKDLDVLLEGIRHGRRIFVNTLKYVYVTTSANFGNMISMAGATLLLPFLPLLPLQILLLNVLSDIPAMAIATDGVDDEDTVAPTRWDVQRIRTFMVVFGIVSSVVDVASFLVLRLLLDADAELFRTGWFVLSVGTELLAMLLLRTRRRVWSSRPGSGLVVTTALVAIVALALPFSAVAATIGFVAPSTAVVVSVTLLLLGYATITETVKRRWEQRRATDRALLR